MSEEISEKITGNQVISPVIYYPGEIHNKTAPGREQENRQILNTHLSIDRIPQLGADAED